MSIHFGEDDEDGVAHPEQVVGFDFEAVERGLGTAEAMEAGLRPLALSHESEALSRIIEICAEGLPKIKRANRRASCAGMRLLCLGLALRPGQIQVESAVELARTLGVTHQAVTKTAREIRRKYGPF